MNSPDRMWRIAARCLLLLAPPLWAAVLVGRYGVDMPWGDQWAAEAPIFEKMDEAALGPNDFFALFLEHRIFFPRIIFYVLARMTHWNVRAELWVVLGLTFVITYNLWRVLRTTGWSVAGTGFWLFLAADVLVFSPIHRENLLWGFQIGFLLPLACLTACLWVGELESARVRFVGVFALSIVCSFSVAGGFMAWLISLPLLWAAGGEGTWKRHRGWWCAWAIGCAGSVALYFHGYAAPSSLDVWLLLREPLPAEKFWFTYLGLPFASGTSLSPLTVAQASSGALGLLLVAALGYLWWRQGDRALMQRCQPWLLLIAISLLNATLTTLGRVRYGLPYALSSRYAIFTVFLPIGLAFLCATIYQHLCSGMHGQRWAGPVGVSLVALGSGLAMLHLLGACDIASGWRDFSHHVWTAKALLETIDIANEPDLVARYLPDLPSREKLARLEKMGFLHPPPIQSNLIGAITDLTRPPVPDAGQLDAAGTGRDLRFRVRGWAVLPQAHRSADAVLLTYDDPQGRPMVFALAEVGSAREDAFERWQDAAYLHCGWEKVIKPGQLPTGAKVIRAWSFDAATARAYRLPGQALAPGAGSMTDPPVQPSLDATAPHSDYPPG